MSTPKLVTYFTNDNERKVWCLVPDSPQWLHDAVYAAHQGDGPNDWIYEECRAACNFIDHDLDGYADAHDAVAEYSDGRVDIYTKDLYQWQADFCCTTTYAAAEDSLSDIGSDSDKAEKRVQILQYCAIEYIAQTMISAHTAALAEEEDEDESEAP